MDLKPATPGPTDGDGVVVTGVVVALEVPSVGIPLLVPEEAMSMEAMSRKKKKDNALATQVIAVETEATRYRVLLRMSIPSYSHAVTSVTAHVRP